ncbi:MAG: hypothetical protein H6Q68_3992 [Firmicutes bacterium]|nr:hypothetical protein [Bacillota bacterium]
MICSLFIVLWEENKGEENKDEISSQVCKNLEEAELFKNELMNTYHIPNNDIKIHEIKSTIKLSLLSD